MSATEETLVLLRSIDASMKQLVKALVGKPVADDRELDSQYGDPVVKFKPRDWTGDSCVGLRMSQCPAPFLDMLAEAFDYFGDQAEAKNEQTDSGKPVAPYKRKDAARARGWAKRVREGRVATTPDAAIGNDAFSSHPDDPFF